MFSDLTIPPLPRPATPRCLSDQILAQASPHTCTVILTETVFRWADKARTLEWTVEVNRPRCRVSSAWRTRRGLWWHIRRWWRYFPL